MILPWYIYCEQQPAIAMLRSGCASWKKRKDINERLWLGITKVVKAILKFADRYGKGGVCGFARYAKSLAELLKTLDCCTHPSFLFDPHSVQPPRASFEAQKAILAAAAMCSSHDD
jgi:hypothetical protein